MYIEGYKNKKGKKRFFSFFDFKIILFFLFLVLTACGPAPREKHFEILDSAVPYFNRFIQEANARGFNIVIDDLIINEADLNNSTRLGQCVVSGQSPLITVNSTFWPVATDAQKEQLVFHELGHCILLLPHNDSQPNIMNTYELTDAYYLSNRKQLIDRLFGL